MVNGEQIKWAGRDRRCVEGRRARGFLWQTRSVRAPGAWHLKARVTVPPPPLAPPCFSLHARVRISCELFPVDGWRVGPVHDEVGQGVARHPGSRSEPCRQTRCVASFEFVEITLSFLDGRQHGLRLGP